MLDTFIDCARGFIDFVQQDPGGVLSRLPSSGYSTQRFLDANGVLQQ